MPQLNSTKTNVTFLFHFILLFKELSNIYATTKFYKKNSSKILQKQMSTSLFHFILLFREWSNIYATTKFFLLFFIISLTAFFT
jgi:hypothetical protein